MNGSFGCLSFADELFYGFEVFGELEEGFDDLILNGWVAQPAHCRVQPGQFGRDRATARLDSLNGFGTFHNL